MNHKKYFALTLVLMLIALSACSPAAQKTEPTLSAPPMPQPTTAEQAPVEIASPEPASTFPVGRFIKSGKTDYGLLFNSDGTFSVFQGNNTFVTGTYLVKGEIFTETSNDGGCETNVSFTYSYDGANLTFNYVGDPAGDANCSGRYADFNNVTYALSQ